MTRRRTPCTQGLQDAFHEQPTGCVGTSPHIARNFVARAVEGSVQYGGYTFVRNLVETSSWCQGVAGGFSRKDSPRVLLKDSRTASRRDSAISISLSL